MINVEKVLESGVVPRTSSVDHCAGNDPVGEEQIQVLLRHEQGRKEAEKEKK